jgi:FkbH-like protein
MLELLVDDLNPRLGSELDTMPAPESLAQTVEHANEAMHRQDWAAAEQYWHAACRLAPDVWQYSLQLATTLLRLSRESDATELLIALTTRVPNEFAPWSGLAEAAEQRHDWPEAEQHWRRATALPGCPPWATAALARCLRAQRRFTEANAALDAVARDFPDDASIFVEYGWIAQGQGDWDAALERWRTVQLKFPALWEGFGGQITALTALGRLDAADELVSKEAPLFPDHPAALHARASAAELRRNWPEAEQRWRDILAVAPRAGWAHNGLARALDEQGRTADADAARDTAFALMPRDLGILGDQARVAERRGDRETALARWRAMRTEFPTLRDAHTGEAGALEKLDRIAEAEATLLNAAELLPDDAIFPALLTALRQRVAAGLPSDRPVPETEPFDAVARANNGKGYLTPMTLRVTPDAALRVAMVGSCQLECWNIPQCAPDGTAFEMITVNNLAALQDKTREEIAGFDFALVQLPIRAVLHDGALWTLSHDDLEGFQRVFDRCRNRIDLMLPSYMKWNIDHGLLTFVADFFVPQDGGMGRLFPRYDLRNTQYFIERLNEHLEQAVRRHRNAYLFDVDRIFSSLGRRFIQDDMVEFISHGSVMYEPGAVTDRLEPMAPLREHYEISGNSLLGPAIWAEVLAMYRTARQIDPVKLVVVDLDDTLWRGVSGELTDLDPAIMLGTWPMGFVEALTWLKKRGILLAILSKNEEQRIREIWPRIFGPKFPLSDFAAVMVDWRPKVEGMAEILEVMNLLPRNVVFIDDNPAERAAMQTAWPDMRVLGRYPYYLRRVLLWSAETQVADVTAESGRRTEMMQRQFERESNRKTLPREDFLREAAPRVTLFRIPTIEHPRFQRVLELINKTNQFNTTGKRWRLEELRALLGIGGEIFAFEVEDKFTAYGLVGVVLTRGASIVQWVMSCRVLGYQIEQAVMATIIDIIAEGATVEGTLIETEVNFPCRSLFASCGFERDGTRWSLPQGARVALPGHVTMRFE